MTAGREFTEEFKREAVGLLESSGRPLMQVAKDLGIQPFTLHNWHGRLGSVAVGLRLRSAPSRRQQTMFAEEGELRRLRKELERAQMECEILKKAVGIFSGQPR
ncbi:transposase [Muricoccus aerilatus]|uniref:transposase n=1 Tax=Muricoccus aerilatus TaxID=452982 RepID=UPI0005C216A9